MSYKDFVAAHTSDLKNGEMKRVTVGEEEILLSRIDDRFYAVSPSCNHYGAPLETGILHDHRIICPWHHACYNAKTGTLLEPPALDSLGNYDVIIEGQDVVVRIVESIRKKQVPSMTRHDQSSDNRSFVIIGAGAAGNAAAQALRECCYEGKLCMISQEKELPYDRPELSKGFMRGKVKEEDLFLRSEDFYKMFDIELLLDKRVVQVDVKKKSIDLDSGETIKFDRLLIATGGSPKTLDIPGSDLENIFTLRSWADARQIYKCSENARIAVIGSNFIATEVAHNLAARDLDVTVISRNNVPFAATLGEPIGELIKNELEAKGIRFIANASAVKFAGNGHVKSIVLDNGQTIDAGMVLVAIGARPVTDFIDGVDKNLDKSLIVDKHFKVARDIYAAGDIVTFPYWYNGENVRIEHWRTAEQLGRVAAYNMGGKELTFDSVPFFWSAQPGFTLSYLGYTKNWDEIITDGDVLKKDFLSFYVKNNRIIAIAGVKRSQQMLAAHELFRLNKMPAPADLKKAKFDLTGMM